MAAYLGYTLRIRRCFVADQLWLMTRIREEEEATVRAFFAQKLKNKATVSNCAIECYHMLNTLTLLVY